MSPAKEQVEVLTIDGREVRITNPDKPYFTLDTKLSKLELVRYYLSIAPGALAGIIDRPIVLKRFVNGAEGDAFYQKRAPENRPEWLRTTTLSFPSGRIAEEVVVDDAAGLAWVVNLGCIDLNPHPVRADDLDHPDELRVDLDPMPGVPWSDILQVALQTREVLEDFGLTGWPKTSGSRGFHVYCRIERRWSFSEVRRAAVALAREVERRAPEIATSKWWKEERHGVFLDYNQNAKDRTVASAYSVRPVANAQVSAPLTWDEVPDVEVDGVRYAYRELSPAQLNALEKILKGATALVTRELMGQRFEAPLTVTEYDPPHRIVFHDTPQHASWMNQIETWPSIPAPTPVTGTSRTGPSTPR